MLMKGWTEMKEKFWDQEMKPEMVEAAEEAMKGMGQDVETDIEKAKVIIKAMCNGKVTKEALNQITDRLNGEVRRFARRNDEIAQSMKEIFLRSGATELQLKWGNYRNMRVGFFDRRRLRMMKEELDGNMNAMLPRVIMIEAAEQMKWRCECV